MPESCGRVPVKASSKVLFPAPIGPEINLEAGCHGLGTLDPREAHGKCIMAVDELKNMS
jgi:hypothetical protein